MTLVSVVFSWFVEIRLLKSMHIVVTGVFFLFYVFEETLKCTNR